MFLVVVVVVIVVYIYIYIYIYMAVRIADIRSVFTLKLSAFAFQSVIFLQQKTNL